MQKYSNMSIYKETIQLLEKLKVKNSNRTIKDMLYELCQQDSKVYNQVWLDQQIKFYTKVYGSVDKKASYQKIYKAEKYSKQIPTLQKNVYKPISNMLSARFDFAGKWLDAYCMNWLSIKDMKNVWIDVAIQKNIQIVKDNWEKHILSLQPAKNLSLFGYDKQNNGMTFLIWKNNVAEPYIYTYVGDEETKYKNFNTFLSAIIE